MTLVVNQETGLPGEGLTTLEEVNGDRVAVFNVDRLISILKGMFDKALKKYLDICPGLNFPDDIVTGLEET